MKVLLLTIRSACLMTGLIFPGMAGAADCCPDGKLPDSKGRCLCTPDWQCTVSVQPTMEVTSVTGPTSVPVNTTAQIDFNITYHPGKAVFKDSQECENGDEPPKPITIKARGPSVVTVVKDVTSTGNHLVNKFNYYSWTNPCSQTEVQAHQAMQYSFSAYDPQGSGGSSGNDGSGSGNSGNQTGNPGNLPGAGGGKPTSPPDENGDCEEGAEAPDEGEAYFNAQAKDAIIAQVYELEGEPPEEVWKVFSVEHRIISVNSPDTRDMTGKLKVEVVDGDASAFVFRNKDGTLTFPKDIDINEGSHDGCGRHDWHTGMDQFEVYAKKPGYVKLKFTTDPDQGSSNGKVAEVIVAAIEFEKVAPCQGFDKQKHKRGRPYWLSLGAKRPGKSGTTNTVFALVPEAIASSISFDTADHNIATLISSSPNPPEGGIVKMQLQFRGEDNPGEVAVTASIDNETVETLLKLACYRVREIKVAYHKIVESGSDLKPPSPYTAGYLKTILQNIVSPQTQFEFHVTADTVIVDYDLPKGGEPPNGILDLHKSAPSGEEMVVEFKAIEEAASDPSAQINVFHVASVQAPHSDAPENFTKTPTYGPAQTFCHTYATYPEDDHIMCHEVGGHGANMGHVEDDFRGDILDGRLMRMFIKPPKEENSELTKEEWDIAARARYTNSETPLP